MRMESHRSYRDFVRDNYSDASAMKVVPDAINRELRDRFSGLKINYFYKYASLESKYTWKNLHEEVFHLSTLDRLNDPAEYTCAIAYKSALYNDEDIRIIKGKINHNFSQIKRYTTIGSLTTSWSNRGLWGNYANGFSGICIEYDAQTVFDSFTYMLSPVIYLENAPKRNLDQIVLGSDYSRLGSELESIKFRRNEYERLNAVREQLRYLIEICTTKHTDWRYEQEWRIVDVAMNIDSVPNIGLNFSNQIGFAPTSIIIGNKVSDENLLKLICISIKQNIPLYLLKVDPYSYRLRKERIRL